MNTVQLKGRRLVFDRTADEKATFAELRRSDPDAILTPSEIMEAKAFTKTVTYKEYRQLRNQLVTFLRFLEGPAKRLDLFEDRDFVIEYLNQVIVSTEEIKKKNPVRLQTVKEATTEAEEEQQARERSTRSAQYAQAASAQQDAILAAVHAVVADWTVEEWETLDKAYERYWKTR
jgi:hypothetical protein